MRRITGIAIAAALAGPETAADLPTRGSTGGGAVGLHVSPNLGR